MIMKITIIIIIIIIIMTTIIIIKIIIIIIIIMIIIIIILITIMIIITIIIIITLYYCYYSLSTFRKSHYHLVSLFLLIHTDHEAVAYCLKNPSPTVSRLTFIYDILLGTEQSVQSLSDKFSPI